MHDSHDDELSEHEARAEECERELGALLDKYGQAHTRRAVGRHFTPEEVENAEELWRKEFGFLNGSDEDEAEVASGHSDSPVNGDEREPGDCTGCS